MKNQKTKRLVLVIAALICVAAVALVGSGLGKIVADVNKPADSSAPEESFAIINIHGTIQTGNDGYARVGYDHFATLDYIDSLIEDEGNKGIFLDVDSGGGTVYESDEMYLKLMEYKEKTGRPIHAFFNGTACSGAYYISCAADYISANRNCWTGSIGVIITVTNYKELYDRLGIEEILITSGANKGMGSSGSEMTDEHRAIYQSLVDESYEQFAGIVSLGRDMDLARVKEIADGRVYSAEQALEIDLIDKIEDVDTAMEYMETVTGTKGYYKQLYHPTAWETMFADIQSIVPKSDVQAAGQLAQNIHSGKPMYIYMG
ncbi:MAG: signal peptide peptidase SppA [Oscillospiraceae bacterium]|nr:signal peptide peptidase SppA [Oscillospiraceae bacterium]